VDKLSFILDLHQTETGVNADLFDVDNPFGTPIASTTADTADTAVANLFAQITISFLTEET
jgi:hypothetical protein